MARMLFVATTLIAAALVAIGLWLESTPVESFDALRRAGVRSAERMPDQARARPSVAARREIVEDAAPPRDTANAPAPRTDSRRVRVHGVVRGGGGPVADFDLSFCATGDPASDSADWDFTDDEGRYEVEVAAGCYAVRDAEGRQVTILDVPADASEQVVDLFVHFVAD